MIFSSFIANATGIAAGVCAIAYVLGGFAVFLFLRERSFTRFFPVLSLVAWFPIYMVMALTPWAVALPWTAGIYALLWLAFGIGGNFILVFRCRLWLKRATGMAGLILFLSPIAVVLDGLLLR